MGVGEGIGVAVGSGGNVGGTGDGENVDGTGVGAGVEVGAHPLSITVSKASKQTKKMIFSLPFSSELSNEASSYMLHNVP